MTVNKTINIFYCLLFFSNTVFIAFYFYLNKIIQYGGFFIAPIEI